MKLDFNLLIVTFLGGGALTVLITQVFQRGKTTGETKELTAKATKILTDTAMDLLETSTQKADDREAKLEHKIDGLERKMDHMVAVIESLTDQLKQNGIDPIIPPKLSYPI